MSEIDKVIKDLKSMHNHLVYECDWNKRYNNTNPLTEDRCNALSEAIQALQEKAEREKYPNGWIPVSERLPENVEFVLYSGYDADGVLEVSLCTTEWFFDYIGDMTAWQPLPKPYEKKEGAE